MYQCAYNVGCCLDKARRDGDMSWEHINELWHDRFATDARYKVWFQAASDSTYMMRVGREEILVRFVGDRTYARSYTDTDIYNECSCFYCEAIEYSDDIVGYHAIWQNKVLI